MGTVKLCPGDNTLTVMECVGGNDCGCDEREMMGCICQHIKREPWLIVDEDCPVHSSAMLRAALQAEEQG